MFGYIHFKHMFIPQLSISADAEHQSDTSVFFFPQTKSLNTLLHGTHWNHFYTQ